jgi:predicted dehydrogenase
MRIAIVEMGPHGKRILEVAQKIPSFEVVAIADRNPAVFEEINLDGTKTYSDALQLLKNQKINFFIITTNGLSHYLLALEAMRQKDKRILVSKPLACTLYEANEMIRVAQEKRSGLPLTIGYATIPPINGSVTKYSLVSGVPC